MKTFQPLFNEKMTRKEFLIRMGLIVLVLTGISGTLQKLKDLKTVKKAPSSKSKNSFGGGAYGV